MKYCRSCGAELLDEAVICPKCGVAVEEIKAPVQKNKLALAGFVLGLVSLFINLYAVPAVLGLVFSIIGLVQINKGNYSNRKQAVAGIVISAISVVWALLYYLVLYPWAKQYLGL